MTSSSARSWHRRAATAWLASALAAASVVVAPVAHVVQPATAAAAGSFADPHFTESTVFSLLTMPTTVRFATDGRAFVAEKRGIIKAYDSIDDSSAQQVLDIRSVVHDFWDRGLLSIALDPDFLNGRPYLYLYYVYDAPPGQTAPVWNDTCPSPLPGATTDGCTVRSKVDRYTVNLSTNVANPGSRLNLIGDDGDGEWCQQFPSHAGGALAFDSDGMLLVTGGDGASFGGMDWGQLGGHPGSPTPVNPCGDPVPSQANAEGGMLRSQDVRTQADATGLDGTIARIDPDTGNAPADNPMKDFAGADQNTKRIVATGFRNPFRVTFRPGHSDLYVGDVGNQTWEEVDRWTMSGSTPTNIPNFGWPCYEGSSRQTEFENVGTAMCTSLYAQGATSPVYSYTHIGTKTPKGPCFPGSANQTSSISGLAFYEGASAGSVAYPNKYDGALFFVDYSRDCLGAILPDGNGIPDGGNVEQIASGIANPVDLVAGPGGDLYYVDHNGGRVVRVKYVNAPIARATADPVGGVAPISIHLDGTTSSEPDSDFSIDGWDWDFYNDGSFDASDPEVDWQIDTPGQYQVKLRVHSTSGLTDTFTLNIDADNAAPVPSIDSPAACDDPDPPCWSVGDKISVSGSATDAEDGTLGAGRFDWALIIHHCPAGCHTHTIITKSDTKSWTFNAPDHEYPSWLEVRLTVTDSNGTSASTSVTLQPRTATLHLTSVPSGVPLSVGNNTDTAPWTATLIRDGSTSLSGPLTRSIAGQRYRFSTWNDSHKRVRDITLSSNKSLTATYVPDAPDSCAGIATRSPKKVSIGERSSGNDDADWFEFHLAHQRDVRITLDDLPVKGRLDLYRSCSNLLASSNHPGTQAESLKRHLAKGTYRIRVTSPDNGWSASPYSLLIKPLPR